MRTCIIGGKTASIFPDNKPGSLWFPDFKEHIFSREPKRWPDCIYFSLGDKEAKTRNPVLKTVQENT